MDNPNTEESTGVQGTDFPLQQPFWSDTTGWDQASCYSTIMYGDIDGDGQKEMVGRSIGGILAYKFNNDMGQWVPLPGTIAMSDQNSWNFPMYYTTLRLADIDGDGQAELLARSGGGIVVYKYVDQDWTLLPPGPPLSDANGWDLPEYYSTIQFADVDGDKQDELIARSGSGIEIYKYAADSGIWSLLGTGPPLSDANGWNVPEFYSTIQTADVDGDGLPEIVGRAGGGIVVYKFVPGNQTWTELVLGPPLSNANGWNYPQYYSTIQFADIDGDGCAELLARSGGGLVAYHYEGPDSPWTEMPAGPPFSDAQGWDAPEYYSTIQTAIITQSGCAGVVARSVWGIITYTYDASSGTWAQHNTRPALSDYAGWNQPQYYSTIRTADVNGDGYAELMARGPNNMFTYQWNVSGNMYYPSSAFTQEFPQFDGFQLQAYQAISETLLHNAPHADIRSTYTSLDSPIGDYLSELRVMPQPNGIPASDWETVQAQIIYELELVDAVNGWFAQTQTYLDSVFISNEINVQYVYDLVELTTANNNSGIAFTIASIVTDALWAILGVGGLPVGFSVAGAAAGLISAGCAAGAALSGQGGGSISTTVAELEGELQNQFQFMLQGNGVTQQTVVQNWGLLQSMGLPILQNQMQWGDTLTGQMVSASSSAYELDLFYLLMPLKWWIAQMWSKVMPYHDYPPQYTYYDGKFVHWLQDGTDVNSAQYPSADLFNALFGAAPTGLGLSVESVLMDTGQWNMPRCQVPPGATETPAPSSVGAHG